PSAAPATIEQIRPPIERPPTTTRLSRIDRSSSRTAASSTGGRSGARRPALRYGKSARVVVQAGRRPVSRATSVDWSRVAPAPGNSRRRLTGAPTRLLMSSTCRRCAREPKTALDGSLARRLARSRLGGRGGVGEDLAGLGQLEHGRARRRLIAAVVGVH